jgi:nicotinate-nucleotide adenylyltransferase
MSYMKKIGIFGGSFDPVHIGHTKICEDVIKEFGLDFVVVLPTAVAPHKTLSDTDKTHRYNMAALAFEDNKKAVVADYEQNESPQYTYETLQHYAKIYKGDRLYLIVGGDSLRELKTWKNPEIITSLCEIISVRRGGAGEANEDGATANAEAAANAANVAVSAQDNAAAAEDAAASDLRGKYGARVTISNAAALNISSTRLRVFLEFGLSTEQFIDERVLSYIAVNKLYAAHRALTAKLAAYIKPSRYLHTAHTVIAGDRIARAIGADREKTFIACALHDCAKYVGESDFAKYGFKKPPDMSGKVTHAFLGEYVARIDFGIEDAQILEAIRCHTTAAPDMGLLAKIVFVADLIEETRDFADLKYLQNEVKKDFEKGFLECLKRQFVHLHNIKERKDIDKHTIEAYEYYIGAGGGGGSRSDKRGAANGKGSGRGKSGVASVTSVTGAADSAGAARQTARQKNIEIMGEQMRATKMADDICSLLYDKKAKNILSIKVSEMTVIADYFVIASASSTTHVKALAEHLSEQMQNQGYPLLRHEGRREGRWVALDFNEVVVHIFYEETRQFYSLERLWTNGQNVLDYSALREGAATGAATVAQGTALKKSAPKQAVVKKGVAKSEPKATPTAAAKAKPVAATDTPKQAVAKKASTKKEIAKTPAKKIKPAAAPKVTAKTKPATRAKPALKKAAEIIETAK